MSEPAGALVCRECCGEGGRDVRGGPGACDRCGRYGRDLAEAVDRLTRFLAGGRQARQVYQGTGGTFAADLARVLAEFQPAEVSTD